MTTFSSNAGVRLLEPLPSGGPLVTARAVQDRDRRPVRVIVVTEPLDATLLKRVRRESADLEALLARIGGEAVAEILDHGVDDDGRPFLVVDLPGPETKSVVSADGAIAVAKAMATGLDALAAQGLVGPPPAVCAVPSGGFRLLAPLPSALDELVAAGGSGTGHEPPEVLAGDDWTRAAQVYACASLVWTMLTGRSPFAGYGSEDRQRLARLNGGEPIASGDAPGSLIDILRPALARDPSARPADPAALTAALESACQSTMLPAAGHFQQDYELVKELGEGSMGRVWAARRRSDGTRVAVKLLHPHRTRDPEVVERFAREYTLLMRVRHPHLVRVHKLILDADDTGLVMELVDGENLRSATSGTRPAPSEAAGWLAQVASALATLHHAGVMHRDIKPQNILITEREGRRVAVLTDFGAARRIEAAAHTRMIGTPAYLAPEIATGREPTAAVDVYGLGIIAYELFAGRHPYRASNTEAMLLAHMSGGAARPEGIGDVAWTLVSACMAKDPKARPTAAEAAERFAALADRPVLAGVAVPDPVPAPPAGRAAAPAERPDAPAEKPVPDEVIASGTIMSARPVPARPEEAPPRRSRRRFMLSALSVLALGVVAGIGGAVLMERSADRPPPGATKPSAQPQGTTHSLPMTLVTTGPGAIQITWAADPATLPGLGGYILWDATANREVIAPLPPTSSSYRISGLRAGEKTCYQVLALVSKAPPGPAARPACVIPTN